MITDDADLCIEGFGILVKSLGDVKAERFVMLMNQSAGDYTEWRRTHLYTDITLEELAAKAKATGDRLRMAKNAEALSPA